MRTVPRETPHHSQAGEMVSRKMHKRDDFWTDITWNGIPAETAGLKEAELNQFLFRKRDGIASGKTGIAERFSGMIPPERGEQSFAAQIGQAVGADVFFRLLQGMRCRDE